MKGIRETAMSKEIATTPPKYGANPSLFNQQDKYDFENDGYLGNSYKKFEPKNREIITINLTIDNDKIGEIADYTSTKYNWNKAERIATEIAYDKIEELLGKNYESKYSVEFNAIEGYEEYEVTVTLIPA